jgi:protein O-GlcNAc transferase
MNSIEQPPDAVTDDAPGARTDDLLDRACEAAEVGRLVDAEALCRQILDREPRHFDALLLLGTLHGQAGRTAQGIEDLQAALAIDSQSCDCHVQLGALLKREGQIPEALAALEAAVRLEPNNAVAHHDLGALCLEAGRLPEAAASFERAAGLGLDLALIHYSRGRALQELKRLDEALASYDKALSLKPDHAKAFNNRGSVLLELKRLDEALSSYDKALALKPDYAMAVYNRGRALQELNRFDEALSIYDKALAIRPDYAEVYFNRGSALRELGHFEESLASYAKALALKPDFAEARFGLCMAELPMLYVDQPDIIARRTAYERGLMALCNAEDTGTNQTDLAKGVGSSQPFFLAYQGYNDRDLQRLYGSFVCRIMARRYPPAVPPPSPAANERVRVGIVSGFFWHHSNWKLPIKGWLKQLDRRQFRIFCYHTGVQKDAETTTAAAMCDRFVQGPLSIDRWRAEILADALHVLIYPEVGMDPVAVTLAAQRLAALQCNSWGHPDTSGLPTLDYYLSSDLMEPPDGQNHYTERLVRLPNLSVYCEPIEPPLTPIARHDLGLRSSGTVYWCGQSLFKYLPQFDVVFSRIARAAGDCQFAFIQYQKSARITELFRQRLDRAFGAFGLRADEHCVFLPRLDHEEFVAATGQCDVFLDSIGWSGCNSTLESLAHDLPIVTMAGSLMRGRHSMAILKMMGVTETITETIDDYVSTAVRLGRDVPWRLTVKNRISENKHRLYCDRTCVTALEEFLNRVARGKPGK